MHAVSMGLQAGLDHASAMSITVSFQVPGRGMPPVPNDLPRLPGSFEDFTLSPFLAPDTIYVLSKLCLLVIHALGQSNVFFLRLAVGGDCLF